MAKTREQKEAQVAVLNDRVANMKSAVIIDYKGMKVKETEELRKNLRAKAVDFHIAKVSLARLVFRKQGIEISEEMLKKPVAIAFAMEDEVSGAKEIDAFAKKNEFIKILGGILENKYIDAVKVSQLASLPSKQELYARLVGTIAGPARGLVSVLAGNTRGLVNILSARKDKI